MRKDIKCDLGSDSPASLLRKVVNFQLFLVLVEGFDGLLFGFLFLFFRLIVQSGV